MTIEKAKKIVNRWIKLDDIFQDYKKGTLLNLSDYDKFCIENCQAMEVLLEEINELEMIMGVWNNRKLINKFNKEYDEEDKIKNPNREYAVVSPDAEEVYKRYYNLLEKNKELKIKLNESTHKATEFESEVYELKEQIKELVELLNIRNHQLEEIKNQKRDYTQENILEMKLENQQKEFIEYVNNTINELECDDVDDEEMKGYLIQKIDIFKEILSKFKEIIGD